MKYWFAVIGVAAWILGVLLVGHAIVRVPGVTVAADVPPGLMSNLLILNALSVVSGLLLVLIGQVSLMAFQHCRQPRSPI
jgi:hypothetical protein